jgi:hypothetical protein
VLDGTLACHHENRGRQPGRQHTVALMIMTCLSVVILCRRIIMVMVVVVRMAMGLTVFVFGVMADLACNRIGGVRYTKGVL